MRTNLMSSWLFIIFTVTLIIDETFSAKPPIQYISEERPNSGREIRSFREAINMNTGKGTGPTPSPQTTPNLVDLGEISSIENLDLIKVFDRDISKNNQNSETLIQFSAPAGSALDPDYISKVISQQLGDNFGLANYTIIHPPIESTEYKIDTSGQDPLSLSGEDGANMNSHSIEKSTYIESKPRKKPSGKKRVNIIRENNQISSKSSPVSHYGYKTSRFADYSTNVNGLPTPTLTETDTFSSEVRNHDFHTPKSSDSDINYRKPVSNSKSKPKKDSSSSIINEFVSLPTIVEDSSSPWKWTDYFPSKSTEFSSEAKLSAEVYKSQLTSPQSSVPTSSKSKSIYKVILNRKPTSTPSTVTYSYTSQGRNLETKSSKFPLPTYDTPIFRVYTTQAPSKSPDNVIRTSTTVYPSELTIADRLQPVLDASYESVEDYAVRGGQSQRPRRKNQHHSNSGSGSQVKYSSQSESTAKYPSPQLKESTSIGELISQPKEFEGVSWKWTDSNVPAKKVTLEKVPSVHIQEYAPPDSTKFNHGNGNDNGQDYGYNIGNGQDHRDSNEIQQSYGHGNGQHHGHNNGNEEDYGHSNENEQSYGHGNVQHYGHGNRKSQSYGHGNEKHQGYGQIYNRGQGNGHVNSGYAASGAEFHQNSDHSNGGYESFNGGTSYGPSQDTGHGALEYDGQNIVGSGWKDGPPVSNSNNEAQKWTTVQDNVYITQANSVETLVPKKVVHYHHHYLNYGGSPSTTGHRHGNSGGANKPSKVYGQDDKIRSNVVDIVSLIGFPETSSHISRTVDSDPIGQKISTVQFSTVSPQEATSQRLGQLQNQNIRQVLSPIGTTVISGFSSPNPSTTVQPSFSPPSPAISTRQPPQNPTVGPTIFSTIQPAQNPSVGPTIFSTVQPQPAQNPSIGPTIFSTIQPQLQASQNPTPTVFEVISSPSPNSQPSIQTNTVQVLPTSSGGTGGYSAPTQQFTAPSGGYSKNPENSKAVRNLQQPGNFNSPNLEYGFQKNNGGTGSGGYISSSNSGDYSGSTISHSNTNYGSQSQSHSQGGQYYNVPQSSSSSYGNQNQGWNSNMMMSWPEPQMEDSWEYSTTPKPMRRKPKFVIQFCKLFRKVCSTVHRVFYKESW